MDDHEYIREALQGILEEEGYEVLLAADGSEALALLHGPRRPCLILLDLMMPGMDGWAFRAAQLRNSALASVPVVVLTASSHVDRSGELRAAGWLRKPFRLPELLRIIERHGASDAR